MALRAFGNRFPLPRFLSSGKWLFYDTPIKMAALNSPLATGPLTLFRTTFYGPDGVIVMALYQLQRIVELQSPSIECLANNGRISPSYDSNRKQGISHLGSASATQSNDESPRSEAQEAITADTVCRFEFVNSSLQSIQLRMVLGHVNASIIESITMNIR